MQKGAYKYKNGPQKVLITKEMAQEMLQRNYEKNRPIRQTVVYRYARDMKCGAWNQDLCEPIFISDKGHLLNGQHRLSAVVESGCSIYFYVQEGLSESSYEYMDNGEKRRTSDFLEGKNRVLVASLCNIGYAIKFGTTQLQSSLLGKVNASRKQSIAATRQEALEFYSDNKELVEELAAFAKRMRTAITCGSPTEYASALFLIHELNDDASLLEEYVNEFCDAQTNNIVVRATRDTIMKACLKKNTKPRQLWAHKIILYSFYCFSNGKEISKIVPSPKIFASYESKLPTYRGNEEGC